MRSGEKAAARFDMESIHMFRVTYKKLRAFLRMRSGDVAFNQKLKINREIKTAYRAAGEKRDLQLHQEHARKPSKKITVHIQSFNYTEVKQKEKAFFLPKLIAK